MADARRITVYRAADGWRWRAQGKNWRIIAAAEEGRSQRARLVKQLEKQYPGVEIVVED